MPLNSLPSEVTSIAGVGDGSVFATFIGASVNFNPIVVIGTPTITLAQKPSGSSAAVSSGSITFDVTGVYIVTLVAAGITRNFTFYCFSPSSNTPVAGSLASARGPAATSFNLAATNAGALSAGQTNALRTTLEASSAVVNVPQLNNLS